MMNYPDCYVSGSGGVEVGPLLPAFHRQLSYLRLQTSSAPYDDAMAVNGTFGRAAGAQTTFLDVADELDQSQCSVSFGTSVEEVPSPSPKDSTQQLLESVGDAKPARRSRSSRQSRKRRQRERDLGRSSRKKEDRRQERHAEAVKNAMTVPVELVSLRPSLKPRHGSRVYRHEELTLLGVRTIQWDGVYALLLFHDLI